jgi:hypothetical protein
MPATSPSLEAMMMAAPNAAVEAPTTQKTDSTRLDPVRVMNRAVDNDIAAMRRLSATGAAKALDMIARKARPRPL